MLKFGCLLLLAGCGTPAREPSAVSVAAKSPELLAPLDVACRAATGHGLGAKDGRCYCEAAGLPGTFSSVSGDCVLAEVVSNTCTDNPLAFSQALAAGDAFASSMSGCLRNVVRLPRNGAFFASPALTLVLPQQESAEFYKKFADWAGKRLKAGEKIAVPAWRAIHATDKLIVHVGLPSEADAARALEDVLLPQVFPLAITDFTSHIFEPDPESLDQALAIIKFDSHARSGLFRLPAAKQDHDNFSLATVHAAVAKFTALGAALAIERTDDLDDNGCLGSCRVTSAPSVMPDGSLAALERVYTLGSVQREAIWIRHGGDLRAVVTLGPGRLPAAIVALRHNKDINGTATVARLYDRQWHLLHEQTFFDKGLPGKIAAIDTRVRRATFPRSAIVGLCESSVMGAVDDPEVAMRLVTGPHRRLYVDGLLRAGSLFGWYPNIAGEVASHNQGAGNLLFGFFPSPYAPKVMADEHGLMVMKAAVEQSPGTQFLPLGGLDCFERFNDWAPSIPPAARVINASLGQYLSRSECERMFASPMRHSTERLLWVVAAGNDGLDSPAEECPAQLSGLDNLIVVAGNEGDKLSPTSNFGLRFADIAAQGQYAEHLGTSFAAPRVAAAAASLAADWPTLTPSDLRALLLLTSRTTGPLSHRVRSGGILDADAARRLAPCVAHARLRTSQKGPLDGAVFEACMVREDLPTDVVKGRLARVFTDPEASQDG